MRRTPGGEPTDDEGNPLSAGWAPGSDLPRFDISATGMRRVAPDYDGPDIEVVEVEDEEPTLIHDRPLAPSVTPLPPVTTPPQRAGSRVESPSSQFAVSAHAFAMQQAQARKSPRPPPPAHIRPVFDSIEEPSYPVPPAPASPPMAQPPQRAPMYSQPLPRAELLPQTDHDSAPPPRVPANFGLPPLAHPPADLQRSVPASLPSPSSRPAPSRPAPPPRADPPPRPVPSSHPPPPSRPRVEIAPHVEVEPEASPRARPLDDADLPPGSRSFFQRTQRLPRGDDDDEPRRRQPPRVVPSVVIQPRRARRSPSLVAGRTGLILGAVALLATIGVGVWFFRPHNGELRIAVFAKSGQIDRAEVYVDGEKRCDVAPCVVTDLPPGARQIQVIAPGYPPMSQTEIVEQGKQRLALVSFVSGNAPPAGAAPAAIANEAAGKPVDALGTLEAAGKSTIRVLVDGADRGSLPIKLKDLTPGSHRLRFDGGDRFEPLDRVVDVTAGRSIDLGAVRLKLLKGRARVDVATHGARVTIEQGGSEHLLAGPWPMTIDIDATKPARLHAKRAGYRDLELPITFADDEAEQAVRVELEPASGGRGASPVRERAAPRERPAPAESPRAEKSDEAPAASGSGTLNINSLPASRVLVDGTPIGSTPKVDYQVSAGTHTITFIHPDLGRKSVTVTVRPGQASVAAVRFKAPEE